MGWPCGCLYVTDTSLIGDKILNTLSDLIKSCRPKNENGNTTGMEIYLDQALIECNFMVGEELQTHLQGLRDFVANYLKEGVDRHYVMARINSIQLAIGCIAHHAENAAQNSVFDFIVRYNCELRSMLFCGDLRDYDGQCLAELPVLAETPH